MAFFAGLLSFFGLLWLVSLFAFKDYLSSPNEKAVIAATIMFVIVGISHFTKKEKIEAMLAGLTKRPRLLNFTSGALEIIFGFGLLFHATRQLSAVALIVLLIAVYPANINVARKKPNIYNVSRLFFQPVYIAWIWFAASL